jgi:nitroreductase
MGNRARVVEFGAQFEAFFRKLHSLVRNPVIRWVSPLFAGMTLIRYYRDRYATVERGLEEVKKGKDLLFWGAPAVIIVHSSMEGSLPVEDGQYAAYNITILAHAMGLGTCFIGYASETMNKVGKIKRSCGIPDKNRVHAVLAVGYPAQSFFKQALRKHYSAKFI